MAFKMKGSPHKKGGVHGTYAHKKSIARAVAQQQPIVAQTRTQADPNLIRAAGDYAESDYTSRDIDYGLTFPEIEGVTLEEDKYWTESYDQYVTRMTEQGRDPISRAAWMTARDEEGDFPEENGGGGDGNIPSCGSRASVGGAIGTSCGGTSGASASCSPKRSGIPSSCKRLRKSNPCFCILSRYFLPPPKKGTNTLGM